MLKYIALLVAAGLLTATAGEAQARGRRGCQQAASCCQPAPPCCQAAPACCTPVYGGQAGAPVADPNLATAPTDGARRYSYQPVQPVQPTYYYAPAYRPRPVDRYLIPKNE